MRWNNRKSPIIERDPDSPALNMGAQMLDLYSKLMTDIVQKSVIINSYSTIMGESSDILRMLPTLKASLFRMFLSVKHWTQMARKEKTKKERKEVEKEIKYGFNKYEEVIGQVSQMISDGTAYAPIKKSFGSKERDLNNLTRETTQKIVECRNILNKVDEKVSEYIQLAGIALPRNIKKDNIDDIQIDTTFKEG